ncbi:HDOD domain-containing protein [Nitrincola sp. MINF-07-Sa-05]|uniref:HDOD domain-containing protein n=1 Tax=Nitrincola salilacus TaxID=3400273 RepID=UPI003917C0B7
MAQVDLSTLFTISEQRPLPVGAELFAAGSQQTHFYRVLQGSVELKLPQDIGRFSESFQLSLRQQFEASQQALLEWMASQQSGLRLQNQGLADLLYAARTRQDEDLSRSELVQKVIGKVPRLPVSTLELLNKVLDEKTTRPEIVELVRHDPALTSMLLKAINSPAYNFHQKVSDLNHAIGLLGFDSVYQIVMLESMSKSMPESPLFQAIYQRSLEVSYIAFTLAQLCAVGKPAEASALGLLHDLGSIVRELMREQNPKLAALLSLLEPAMLGAELLKSWHLPEHVCSSIQYQDHPEFARPDQVPQIMIPYLSDYLTVLGQSDLSLEQVMEDKLLPALRKRKAVLPATLIEVLG